jgi:hypothetical protein
MQPTFICSAQLYRRFAQVNSKLTPALLRLKLVLDDCEKFVEKLKQFINSHRENLNAHFVSMLSRHRLREVAAFLS